MKKSLFTALAALGLMGMATVEADTICKNCEYTYWGRTLGSYWPGDRGTFGNREIGANLNAMGYPDATGFDDYWIFDLNAASVVSLAFDVGKLLAYPPTAIEVYVDLGSVCGPVRCNIVIPAAVSDPLISKNADRRWTGTLTLPPGRYAIRVAAGLRTSGESSYTGTLVVKVTQ